MNSGTPECGLRELNPEMANKIQDAYGEKMVCYLSHDDIVCNLAHMTYIALTVSSQMAYSPLVNEKEHLQIETIIVALDILLWEHIQKVSDSISDNDE